MIVFKEVLKICYYFYYTYDALHMDNKYDNKCIVKEGYNAT